MKDLHGGGSDADVHLLSDQLVGNAVEVPFGRDMIIEFELQLAPAADLETIGGKRAQSGLVHSSEQARPRAFAFAKWLVVEPDEQFGNSFVHLEKAEERPLAQSGDDPALHHLHRGFYF